MGGVTDFVRDTVKKVTSNVAEPVASAIQDSFGGGSSGGGSSSAPAPEPAQSSNNEQRSESVDQGGSAESLGMSGPDFAERSRRLREGLLRGESLFSRLGSSQRNQGTRNTLG